MAYGLSGTRTKPIPMVRMAEYRKSTRTSPLGQKSLSSKGSSVLVTRPVAAHLRASSQESVVLGTASWVRPFSGTLLYPHHEIETTRKLLCNNRQALESPRDVDSTELCSQTYQRRPSRQKPPVSLAPLEALLPSRPSPSQHRAYHMLSCLKRPYPTSQLPKQDLALRMAGNLVQTRCSRPRGATRQPPTLLAISPGCSREMTTRVSLVSPLNLKRLATGAARVPLQVHPIPL